MNRREFIQTALLCVALVGCQRATVAPVAKPLPLDLEAELACAKARLTDLLPDDMHVTRAELVELDEGKGILLHAFPKDADKAHPSFALFLWPRGNPKDIAYETGEGAHTFHRLGSSEKFRVYYSGPSGPLKNGVQRAFCTKEQSSGSRDGAETECVLRMETDQ